LCPSGAVRSALDDSHRDRGAVGWALLQGRHTLPRAARLQEAWRMIETQLEPTCHVCGIPADASYFDDSSIAKAPDENSREVVLAKFELHPNTRDKLRYF